MIPDADVAAILRLHEQARQAHLTGDAALLASGFANRVLEAGRGRVKSLTRDELRQRFATYFAAVHYREWRDVEPPVVSVSGPTAWLLVQIHASLTNADGSPRPDFESAWLAIYERLEGEWLMTAISSSVEDLD